MFREGQQIGSYVLVKRIGRGGFGEVWLAEKRTQFVTKKVAIKLPHEDQVNFDAIRHEATLWEQASGHPNILPIIDADVYDDQVIIVSEYADGGSLADKLKAEGKLPVKKAVEIVIGVLNGLEFLHSRQIIHRDIKPQNILLQGETPRLADFGISRAMNSDSFSSTVSGTDAYMAPESFDGKRDVQTDIWSVGVVLYQLLKGGLPFPQQHPTERMFAIVNKDWAPLPDEIVPDLKRVVVQSLAKNPADRFKTAVEMSEALQKVLFHLVHPTHAPTEIFNKKILSGYETVEEKDADISLVTYLPVKELLPTQPPSVKPASFTTSLDKDQEFVTQAAVTDTEVLSKLLPTEAENLLKNKETPETDSSRYSGTLILGFILLISGLGAYKIIASLSADSTVILIWGFVLLVGGLVVYKIISSLTRK